VQIAVTELKDNTFYAMITIAVDGSEIEIDSRPSDAIALAVRSGAPIYAAEAVIEESAIEWEHEEGADEEAEPLKLTEDDIEQFRKFLENVSPEDFEKDKD
jgi:bifunctional DNase/RNase